LRTKTLRRIEATEADILKTIIDYLEANRILYIRVNRVSPVSTKEGIRFRKLRPSELGAPDLVIWAKRGWKHFSVAIEVKTLKGRQSPAQMKWELTANKSEVPYFVVRSLEELLRVL